MSAEVARETKSNIEDMICPECGGALAEFPEPDINDAEGTETRCLMCSRTVPRSEESPDTPSSRAVHEVPSISLSKRAAVHLRSLLKSVKPEGGKVFRLQQKDGRPDLSLSTRKRGDIGLPASSRPVLLLSRTAAKELDGARIGITRQPEGKTRLQVKTD